MSTILSAKNISLEYKIREGMFNSFRHQALRDISFDLIKGETFGVIGKNGSGKSSLLQVLAGLMAPTSGSLELPAGSLRRSLLTLGLGFRPDLPGSDNVILSLILQNFSKQQAHNMLEDIREFADIGEYFDKPVRTYSAGMRARLGFATGIRSKVDVLLIDEVLSVGDAQFRQRAEQTMLDRISGQQTVVLVSQSPAQIRDLCDRALWIHDSSIKEIGDPRQVSRAYIKHFELDASTG
jgi:lipopolysaccharide transport system ATP-binding protein